MAPPSPHTRYIGRASGVIAPAVPVVASAARRRRHVFRHPWRSPAIGGGSGADDPAAEVLRARIRAALASGALPPLPGPRSWVGRGSGHPCAGCGEPLQSTDVEHEVELAARPEQVRVHTKCYLIWKTES